MGVVTSGQKKKLSEHIDMGSSFEHLVATSPTVKTDSKSDKRFGLQNILNFRISHLMRVTPAISSFSLHARIRTDAHARIC